ncbi:MAG: molybdopterin molybdotransferase MoeA [Leptospirillum sp.]|jgi:molybdopterin molybdotransferase
MITPDEALSTVLRNVAQLSPVPLSLADALGCRLSEDIQAPCDFPPFDRSMMDGFAVCLGAVSGRYRQMGVLKAGESWPIPLRAGECVEIMTGAPCPLGTDLVFPYEDVESDGAWMTSPQNHELGQYMAKRGSECRNGETVLKKGAIVTPLVIAVLAAFGQKTVHVIPPPQVAIIVTGREIVREGKFLEEAQIHDANGPMLMAMACMLGVRKIGSQSADDDLFSLTRTLDQVSEAEVVLITGGVSEGLFDLVPEALQKSGAEILFHKVSQKPGKPFLFARKGSQLYFALPGNPLSAHLCFHRYVTPVIRMMQGNTLPSFRDRGVARIAPNQSERTRFELARVQGDRGADQPFRLTVYEGRHSSDLFSVHKANSVVCVPPSEEGNTASLKEKDWEFEWLESARMEDMWS